MLLLRDGCAAAGKPICCHSHNDTTRIWCNINEKNRVQSNMATCNNSNAIIQRNRLQAVARSRPLGHVTSSQPRWARRSILLSVWFGGATWQARFKQTSWTNGERLAAVGHAAHTATTHHHHHHHHYQSNCDGNDGESGRQIIWSRFSTRQPRPTTALT